MEILPALGYEPVTFDPVVLNHSCTFLTGLGPFWLAQSVRPQLKASTVGDPADAALATLSVASNQIQSLYMKWSPSA